MRRTPIFLLIVLMAAGCTSAGKAPPGSTAPGSSPSQNRSAPATDPSASPEDAAGGSPDMVLLHRRDRLAVVDSGNGETLYEAPSGLTSPDWHFVYSAVVDGSATTVTATDLIRGGENTGQLRLAGRWVIPTIGLNEQPAGISADGRTLVLAESEPGASTTRFALLPTELSRPARIISLAGRFSFDGMSPDGSRIYVIEYLAGQGQAHYAVRSVLASGTLEDGVIVDKREGDEAMAGTPIDRVSDGGMVYTLYRGSDGPFVHALDTANRVAFCIDLPSDWAAASSGWSVALGPSKDTLYATNSTLGVVAEVDLKQFEVRKTGTFPAKASIELTKFLGAPGTAGSAVVAPDGATLYVLDTRGVLVISTNDLKPRGRLLADQALMGLAMSADGRALYTVGADGRAARVDPRSGTVLSRFGGDGFGRILIVMHEPA